MKQNRAVSSIVSALAALASVVVASDSHAATMIYADVPALTEASDVVVEGVVVDSDVYLDASSGHITTRWTVQVVDALKGDVAGTVSFTQWAGELDGIAEVIPGDARFRLGERAVVFLRVGEEGGLYLTALGQSKFEILDPTAPSASGVEPGPVLRMYPLTLWNRGSVVVRDLRGVEFYQTDDQGLVDIVELPLELLTLESLQQQVLQTVEGN
jgi:hypothetical protein